MSYESTDASNPQRVATSEVRVARRIWHGMTRAQDINELLYGHDATERIVAVEYARNNQIETFRRAMDGQVTSTLHPMQSWFVTTRKGAEHVRAARADDLAGDLPLTIRLEFDSWGDYRSAVDQIVDQKIAVHRFNQPTDQFLIASGMTLFKGMTFDDLVRIQIDLETVGLDPTDPESRILAIAVATNRGESDVIATGDMSESEAIESLNDWIRRVDPDVIEGHNIYNFDLPFLIQRARAVGTTLRWGRDESEPKEMGTRRFKAGARSIPFQHIAIHGRHIIDTYQQIQRYDYAGEMQSYGLKESIDSLGLTKADRVFVPGNQIASLWQHDRNRIIAYALDDIRDVALLSELATPTEFYQTQILPRSFQRVATGGPGEKINLLMSRVYLSQNHGLPLPKPSRGYPGGYTEVRRTGVFRPVVKCDVESLYPAIMLVDGIKPSSDVLDVYLPLLRVLTNRRLDAKSQARRTSGAERARWNGLQSSFKVLINSFSGYLGYGRALFNDFDAAEQITLRGQEIIQRVVEELESKGAEAIEIDTDGVYFRPPASVSDTEAQESFVARISSSLPDGINLAFDGSYAGMASLRTKNYALLDTDGRMILKGSGLRSRRDEGILRQFLEMAAKAFIETSPGDVRNYYLDVAKQIQERSVPPNDIARWETITEKTFTSESNRRVASAAEGERIGERVPVYQRADGSLARIEDYAHDEDVDYLLRRLNDMGRRFEPLLDESTTSDYVFPRLTSRSDIEAIRRQPPTRQLTLFD